MQTASERNNTTLKQLTLDGVAAEHDDGYSLQLIVWPNNPGPSVGEMWIKPHALCARAERKRAVYKLERFLNTYKRCPCPPRDGQIRRGLTAQKMRLVDERMQ